MAKAAKPLHPGIILKEKFLEQKKLTQRELSERLKVPFQRVNELVRGKRGITPATALRLAKFFGNKPEYWMKLQAAIDLEEARRAESKGLRSVKPLRNKKR